MAVYPILPGRSPQAPSDWMRSVCELPSSGQVPRRCTIGCKSGLWLGHSRTVTYPEDTPALSWLYALGQSIEGSTPLCIWLQSSFPQILTSVCIPAAQRHDATTALLQRFFSIMLWNPLPFRKNSKQCYMLFTWSGFCPATLPLDLNDRNGHPYSWSSHLYRGLSKFCWSDCRVLGYLPDQGPSCLFSQFGQTGNSRRSPGGSKLFLCHNTPLCSWEHSRLYKWLHTLALINVSTQVYRRHLQNLPWTGKLLNCGSVYLSKTCPVNSIGHMCTPVRVIIGCRMYKKIYN